MPGMDVVGLLGMLNLENMVAYEVFLNDKRLCLAGIDGDGVLNAI